MNQKKSEDAVSPVIGVMLLLVVTIVIAAVVAVFASGVGADAEPAPATVLNVADISDGYVEMSQEWELKEEAEGILFGEAPEGFTLEITEMSEGSEDDPPMVMKGTLKASDGTVVYEWDLSSEEDPKVYDTPYRDLLFSPIGEPEEIIRDAVTLTINCVSGDTLNLEKVSVNVYDSEGTLIAEKNSFPGTISAGDTRKLTLDEIDNGVLKGKKVEVVVLYGDHVIVSKELKVTRG